MNDLPDSYYSAVAIFAVLLIYGTAQYRSAWAMPYNAVICTVAVWYLVEPLYLDDFFLTVPVQYIQAAYDAVLIFFATFAIATPVVVRWFRPRPRAMQLGQILVPVERVLVTVMVLWLVLLAYGIVRMHGDVLGALFPLSARSGGNMWSRQAGAGAGAEGFIISTASYLYMLCLSGFGMLFFLLPRGGYRRLALLLIVVSWPYVFLQGSRNLVLSTVCPGLFSYILFSRHFWGVKALWIGASGGFLDLAFRVIFEHRNVGFGSVDLSSALSSQSQHLGLNMASELVFCMQYISEGTMQIGYGMRYLGELANVIPRAIWADKPLIGIDYAVARGFASDNVDIGVFATISTGVIGGGVLNFGWFWGPVGAGVLASMWVGLLTRFRVQRTSLRLALFLVGLGLTFNLGRDITLLVLWPMVFGYLGVRLTEWQWHRTAPATGLVPYDLTSAGSEARDAPARRSGPRRDR